MFNLNNVDPVPVDGSQGLYALRVVSDAFAADNPDITPGAIVMLQRGGQPQPNERAFVWLAETEQAVIRLPQPGDVVRARVVSVIHHL